MAEPTAAADAAHEHIDVIEDREGYLAALEVLRAGHGPIAIDAERASGFRYSQRAYLIQVYRRGAEVFLFDPIAIGDMSELGELGREEEWVLHAASQDLACLREVGIHPVRLFDTELGARLAGLPRVGLGTVVQELLGIHLAKEHSAADWSTRPLPQAWLVYAALDVELLVDVRDAVAGLLEEQGKVEAAAQEFQAVLDRETPVRQDPWRRLSGIHGIRSQRILAVAKSLWETRDAYAREIDTAPGRLVPDASLVNAAKANPASKRELAALREFTGRASRSQIDRWWGAIEAGRAMEDLPAIRVPGDGPPPPRAWADKNPEADARLKAARPAVQAVAEELGLPVENLLTPDLLRRLAWTPPEVHDRESIAAALAALGARPWQIDATAQAIAQSFVDGPQEPPEPVEPAS
ncbi:HRDC domain-containing protein [Homoserinibacter sp. YIM 151385]|uniref:HRDC domain-containing protein n=1 Tax=Homoserinibacter sp. YIM 151385 TaxID=2985506 RepID=UPI0022F03537|nr:HRDC domain-containing protein [Homoserinibacter sp. YIM 151385]WBU38514.1 HRDC domain-containing protein [Homoserinibacter sp. YIM 151385]